MWFRILEAGTNKKQMGSFFAKAKGSTEKTMKSPAVAKANCTGGRKQEFKVNLVGVKNGKATFTERLLSLRSFTKAVRLFQNLIQAPFFSHI